MKKVKAWKADSIVTQEELDCPVKFPEGMIGFIPVFKSKAAAHRAGYKKTKLWTRVRLFSKEKEN